MCTTRTCRLVWCEFAVFIQSTPPNLNFTWQVGQYFLLPEKHRISFTTANQVNPTQSGFSYLYLCSIEAKNAVVEYCSTRDIVYDDEDGDE